MCVVLVVSLQQSSWAVDLLDARPGRPHRQQGVSAKRGMLGTVVRTPQMTMESNAPFSLLKFSKNPEAHQNDRTSRHRQRGLL